MHPSKKPQFISATPAKLCIALSIIFPKRQMRNFLKNKIIIIIYLFFINTCPHLSPPDLNPLTLDVFYCSRMKKRYLEAVRFLAYRYLGNQITARSGICVCMCIYIVAITHTLL